MTVRRIGRVGALVLAAGLAVTACGGGDGDGGDTAAGSTLKNDCSIAHLTATAVPGKLVAYKSAGDESKLPVDDSTLKLGGALIKDAKVRAIADKGKSNAEAFNAALAKKDDAARDKAITDAKPILDEYKAACSAANPDLNNALGYLEESLASGTLPEPVAKAGPAPTLAAAPTSSAPAAPKSSEAPKAKAPVVTPKGTKVKLGKPVVLAFDNEGKKIFVEFTVTAVDTASADDLKVFKPDALKNVKGVVYVRAEAREIGADGTRTPVVSGLRDLFPTFEVGTSDGTSWKHMTVFGSFKPCKDDKYDDENVIKYCKPFAISSGSTDVTVVGLTGTAARQTDSDNPLYIWTK